MKRIVCGLIATMVALSMAGCTAAPSQASSAATPTLPDTSGPNKEKVTLSAMFIGGTSDEAMNAIRKEVTDKFNAENPYGVTIELQFYENEQYKTKLTTLMASNTPTDIFFTWEAGFLKPFVESGKIYEIGQSLEQDAEWKGRFNDSAFGPVTFDDKIYAVPTTQTVTAVFYNKKIFAEQQIEIPKTYDEFTAVCAKLNEKGITPLSMPIKDAWIAGQTLQQLSNGVGGAALYDDIVSGAAKWDDPRYVEAAKMFSDLLAAKAFPDGFLGMTHDEGRNLFTEGKTAMMFDGTWSLGVFSDPACALAGDIGIFPMPPKNPENANVTVASIDYSMAISASCKNIEAASAYVKLYSDPEIQSRILYEAKSLPATNVKPDTSKLDPLSTDMITYLGELKGLTPWLDRVFGAGEGVEFNNAAQGIMGAKDPEQQMKDLQQFAVDNALR